ncbi:hypothetical protein FJY90_08425 [Candidatus Gottesmanbacteria bacterium]|nr:hypothetical protein [Candidatus Gottesmanbacteria bacterium]
MASTFVFGAEKDSYITNISLINKWQFLGFQNADTGAKDIIPEEIKVYIEFKSKTVGGSIPRNMEGKGPCNFYFGDFVIDNT